MINKTSPIKRDDEEEDGPYKWCCRSTTSENKCLTFESDTITLEEFQPIIDISMNQLYNNVFDIHSSDQSSPRPSFISYGSERVDSELFRLATSYIKQEKEEENNKKCNSHAKVRKSKEQLKEDKRSSNPNIVRSVPEKKKKKLPSSVEGKLCHGFTLLKQAKIMISSGINMKKALDLLLSASNSFESISDENCSIELATCLLLLADTNSSLGRHDTALSLVNRAVRLPLPEHAPLRSLSKFSVLGHILTLTRLAEAHLLRLDLTQAENLCLSALAFHTPPTPYLSRLMGVICHFKGAYADSLRHFSFSSVAMAAARDGHGAATVQRFIGEVYSAMDRPEEAEVAYGKALRMFGSLGGEYEPEVGVVYVSIAGLCCSRRRSSRARMYCRMALSIFEKPFSSVKAAEVVVIGLVGLSGVYLRMGETAAALTAAEKATTIYGKGVKGAAANALVGVLWYMVGKYEESHKSLRKGIAGMRMAWPGSNPPAPLGVALNLMALSFAHCCRFEEAVIAVDEAQCILCQHGSYGCDSLAGSLGVLCNCKVSIFGNF